jgi:hypothetical protein
VILTGIAMLVYPGGSLNDKSSIHYEFFHNFFSDLGATVTVSGKKNTISNILFIMAVGTLGLVMIYFSNIWRAMSVDVHKLSFIGHLSKLCLIISGAGFIGIAFTPWNMFFEYHVILEKTAFSFLLAWTLLIMMIQITNKKLRTLLISNSIYVIILGYYVYLLFYGPKTGTPEGVETHAVAQKAIVYFSIANFTIQAFGIMRFLRIADFRRSKNKNFYV